MPTRRPDHGSPDDTLRTDQAARTRKGTVVDAGLAKRIEATHETETNKDIAYYQGEVFTALQAVGYSPEFAQEGVIFYTAAYNHCGNLLIAREKVLQYCVLRSEGADHDVASQKILATLPIQTIIVDDGVAVEQETVVDIEPSPNATFVESAQGFDAFDPRWYDQSAHLPVASPTPAIRVEIARVVPAGSASVRPVSAPNAAIEAVVHHLSLGIDPSRADTILEADVRGDVAFRQALAEQGLACRKLLISEGYSFEIAEEGSVYYQEKLKKFAIPARVMQETRVYCQQRKLGVSITDATLAAQGQLVGIAEHDDAMDASLERTMSENRERGRTRKQVFMALGFGVLLAGIIGSAYYIGVHRSENPVENPPSAQP